MSAIRGDKRVDLGKHVIARLEKNKKRFEILVNPKKAWDYKEGKDIDIRDVLEGYMQHFHQFIMLFQINICICSL